MAAKKVTTRTSAKGAVSTEEALVVAAMAGLKAEEATLARDNAHRLVDDEHDTALAEAEAGLAGSGIPPASE
jgi:hypothetical protein